MASAPHHYTILFHLLKEQIWPIHFHPEKYPVSPTAESKQLVMVTKTLDIQALAICAATVLFSFCILIHQTASIPQALQGLLCIHASPGLIFKCPLLFL